MIWLMLACVVGGDSGTGGAGEVEVETYRLNHYARLYVRGEVQGVPIVSCCWPDSEAQEVECRPGQWATGAVPTEDYDGTRTQGLEIVCPDDAQDNASAWVEVRWLP